MPSKSRPVARSSAPSATSSPSARYFLECGVANFILCGCLPFAKADVVIDAVATPLEIDHALGRLELAARDHGSVIGITSALPAAIDHIARWAHDLESRGIVLVPITAVALPKQT